MLDRGRPAGRGRRVAGRHRSGDGRRGRCGRRPPSPGSSSAGSGKTPSRRRARWWPAPSAAPMPRSAEAWQFICGPAATVPGEELLAGGDMEQIRPTGPAGLATLRPAPGRDPDGGRGDPLAARLGPGLPAAGRRTGRRRGAAGGRGDAAGLDHHAAAGRPGRQADRDLGPGLGAQADHRQRRRAAGVRFARRTGAWPNGWARAATGGGWCSTGSCRPKPRASRWWSPSHSQGSGEARIDDVSVTHARARSRPARGTPAALVSTPRGQPGAAGFPSPADLLGRAAASAAPALPPAASPASPGAHHAPHPHRPPGPARTSAGRNSFPSRLGQRTAPGTRRRHDRPLQAGPRRSGPTIQLAGPAHAGSATPRAATGPSFSRRLADSAQCHRGRAGPEHRARGSWPRRGRTVPVR